jgi:aryl-alcohol dehydrogenase-like predicted oxidoreductase
MKIKKLGRTGLKVSEICLGTMTFGKQSSEETAFEIMDIAVEGGVTFFDTADVYPLGGDEQTAGRTEEIVGNWLTERGAREQIVLATKCRGAMGPGPNEQGLSRKHILRACDESLRRLQTDYIDLYQVHSPDNDTRIDETLEALDSLVRAGKVRYLGCSNFPAYQLAEALWTSDKKHLARFDCVQPRYNLLFRMIEEELLPLCRAQGVGVIVFNPLAGGVLTGRYEPGQDPEENTRFSLPRAGELYKKRYWNDAVLHETQRLKHFFTNRGQSLTHAALAWTLAQDGLTSAIVGASKPDQLRDSLHAVDFTLDGDALAQLNAAWYQLPRERDPQVARR